MSRHATELGGRYDKKGQARITRLVVEAEKVQIQKDIEAGRCATCNKLEESFLDDKRGITLGECAMIF